MRILFVTHTIPEHWKNKYGWTYRIGLLRELGAEIRCVEKKEWTKIWKIHDEFMPDIIVGIGPITLIPIILKKLGKIPEPIVFDWNEEYPEIMSKYPLIRQVQEYIIKHTDFITTPAISRFSRARQERDECLIHLWQQTTGEYTEERVKLIGQINAVYIGEQSDTKGTNKIIAAASETPAITYYLIGKVNQEYAIQATDNVIFVGELSHDEVYKYINAADFCILTQDNDSAIKLFEYYRAKKPIVGIDGINIMYHSSYIYLMKDLKNLKYYSPEWFEFQQKKELVSDKESMREYLRFLEKCVAL
jgi:hypothetical protein